MSKTNKRLVAISYVLANLIFIFIIVSQWGQLKELPDIISNYSEYRSKEYLGVNKFLAQSLFYSIGLGLSLFVLVDIVKAKTTNRNSLLLFGIYFFVFILLELPLHEKHVGWGNQHGHSYWKGFHFH